MKYYLLIILSFMLISCGASFTTLPNAPNVKTRYYDEHNSYIGYSVESNNVIRYYDKKSRYIGKSIRR